MFDYGRAPARWAYVGDGYHEAVAQAEGSALQLRLTTDLNVGFEATAATPRTLLKEGDSRFVAVSSNDRAPPRTIEEASDLLRWTWQHWVDRATFPDHRWRGHLQRSARNSFVPQRRIQVRYVTVTKMRGYSCTDEVPIVSVGPVVEDFPHGSICYIPTATTRRNRARAPVESEPHDLGGLPLSRLRRISPGSDNSHVSPGLLSTFRGSDTAAGRTVKHEHIGTHCATTNFASRA
jgi:hypothetical protein